VQRLSWIFKQEVIFMGNVDPKAKIADAETRFFTTRQMKPNEKGYVGYETIWKPFHKEVPYETPKKP